MKNFKSIFNNIICGHLYNNIYIEKFLNILPSQGNFFICSGNLSFNKMLKRYYIYKILFHFIQFFYSYLYFYF
jgi:hypothetical protein